jgi:hypothetical protein
VYGSPTHGAKALAAKYGVSGATVHKVLDGELYKEPRA